MLCCEMEWNGVDPDWAHGMYLLKGKPWAFALSSLNFGKELFLDSSVQSLVAGSQRGAFGKGQAILQSGILSDLKIQLEVDCLK